MNKLKPAILSLILFALAGVFSQVTAQVEIVPLTKDLDNKYNEGMYYALPKNKIRVDIWVERVDIVSGPYSEYASRLLGLDNVPRSNSTVYNITGASMSSIYEVDPEQFYYIRVPEKNKNNIYLSLNPEGLMQSAYWHETGKASERKKQEKDFEKPIFRDDFMDVTVPGIIEKVDTFIRRINVDTTTFEEVFFRKTFIEKSTEQKAREAANFILKLEEDRFGLITGYQEVSYSAETMAYMNDQLLNLQNEYLALFKGKTTTTTRHFSFVFEPLPDNAAQRKVLCKFSPTQGVLDTKSPFGEPVTIEFTKAGNIKKVEQHHKLREQAKRKATGFFYRIPDKANFTIRAGEDVLTDKQFVISQLGTIVFLPFDGVSEVQFHPETGSLKYMRIKEK